MTRLIQISDCHVVSAPKLVSGRLDTRLLLARAVDRISADLEKIGPVDGVVVTGDISDDGSIDSYETFLSVMEPIGVPVFLIPGNHDKRESMFEVFGAPVQGQSEKFQWVRRFDDMQLIGLDTVVPKSGGGAIDAVTLDFLSETLSESPEVPTLIALHHPPFNSGVGFMDAIGLRGFDELREALGQSRAEIRLICGHLHMLVAASLGQHIAISSPATCSSFDTDYRDVAPVGFTTRPGGYMIHEWCDGFRSTCIPLVDGTGPHPF